jgi:hypothetical protein
VNRKSNLLTTTSFLFHSLNERLSFLKYTPGNYFRSHCDGRLALPDGRRSFITIQIYLGGDNDLLGGATRFLSNRSNNTKNYLDVDPKLGRVLIFQQRNLTHSGEDVIRGTKYALRSDLMYTRKPSGMELIRRMAKYLFILFILILPVASIRSAFFESVKYL